MVWYIIQWITLQWLISCTLRLELILQKFGPQLLPLATHENWITKVSSGGDLWPFVKFTVSKTTVQKILDQKHEWHNYMKQALWIYCMSLYIFVEAFLYTFTQCQWGWCVSPLYGFALPMTDHFYGKSALFFNWFVNMQIWLILVVKSHQNGTILYTGI